VTTGERAALVDRLRAGPRQVAGLAVAASARRGSRPADGWSERQIVAHLVRVDREVFQARLRDLTGAAEPQWSWVEPGAEPGHASLTVLISRFAAVREATIAHLAGLDEAGWARSGVHTVYGRLDVAALLGIAVDHDTDHLAELERRAG
jgi:DinB superfamily